MTRRSAWQVQPQEVLSQKTLLKSIIFAHTDKDSVFGPKAQILELFFD